MSFLHAGPRISVDKMMWNLQRDREIGVKEKGGCCKSCKHVKQQFCTAKKKILNTLNAYCHLWKEQENAA